MRRVTSSFSSYLSFYSRGNLFREGVDGEMRWKYISNFFSSASMFNLLAYVWLSLLVSCGACLILWG